MKRVSRERIADAVNAAASSYKQKRLLALLGAARKYSQDVERFDSAVTSINRTLATTRTNWMYVRMDAASAIETLPDEIELAR